ncbi:hypothetical protein [Rhizobium leguminosarum]|uniref:hypothetical protein n=1 Tax=Rhizobium leguminosarum TaxID=384 RepID=UPI003F96678C
MIRQPMQRTLVVTTKATDLTLLTVEERREAAGLGSADASKDSSLLALDQRIAAAITSECKIAIGGGNDPTLKKETLTETFYGVHVDRLVLSRRHNVVINSLTDCGTALVEADYIVDPETAIVTRIRCDRPAHWHGSKIIVVYDAGFEAIPGDLKMAAIDFFRLAWLEKSRDPALKGREIDVPDVQRIREDYWVGSVPGQAAEGAVPAVVAGQLMRFRNTWVR